MSSEHDKKIVFLFARQRSGTGALSSLLNQHPECNYLGEVFGDALEQHPMHYFNWLQGAVSSEPELVLPDHAEVRFQRYLDFLRETVKERVLVLDVKLSQAHHFEPYDRGVSAQPRLFSMVKVSAYPVIFLRRRNLVRTYLSRLSADKSGIWHATGGVKELQKLQVDTNHLVNSLKKLAQRERYIDNLVAMYPDAVELEYADLFDSATNGLTQKSARALEETLGIKALDALHTKQQKLRPGRLEDIVENCAEVRLALSGTRFEEMTR